MITLTGQDASLLALLAECRGKLPKSDKQTVLNALSCNKAKNIALNIIKQNKKHKEAKAYMDWAESLRAKR